MKIQSQTCKIIFLVDNNPGPICPGEHGLSVLIKADTTLLFDTGQSGLFLENATHLGIDLDHVDTAVLSHGHYDHGNGLGLMTGRKLICHPLCFTRRYREKDSEYIGLKFNQEFAQANFKLILSSVPHKLSESITFLGEIPRLNSFESRQTSFYKENGSPDFVFDDSALVIKTGKGLVIIAGCGHSGICNITEYAKKLTGTSKIAAVIGGFHLKEGNPAIEATIDYLLNAEVALLMPCHCIDDAVIRQFKASFNYETVFSGKIKEFGLMQF